MKIHLSFAPSRVARIAAALFAISFGAEVLAQNSARTTKGSVAESAHAKGAYAGACTYTYTCTSSAGCAAGCRSTTAIPTGGSGTDALDQALHRRTTIQKTNL